LSPTWKPNQRSGDKFLKHLNSTPATRKQLASKANMNTRSVDALLKVLIEIGKVERVNLPPNYTGKRGNPIKFAYKLRSNINMDEVKE